MNKLSGIRSKIKAERLARDRMADSQQFLLRSRGELGAELRKAREARGMSLRSVAKKLGFSPPFVSDMELGNRAISPETATRYLELLETK